MDENKTLLQRAIEFAVAAHEKTFRKKSTTPYIVHPIEVMKIVCRITDDEEVRAAAVLHDTVEDTFVTKEMIEKNFGERVAALVASESENKREGIPEKDTWIVRKQETLDHLKNASEDTKIICLGDKLANMRDIYREYRNIGDGLWDIFNAPDKGKGPAGKAESICWYYSGIVEELKDDLSGTMAWKELNELVQKTWYTKE